MKQLLGVMFLSVVLLVGCGNQSSTKTDVQNTEGELEQFVTKYNTAVKNLEKNTDFEIDRLHEDNFSELEKPDDGFGYKQMLDAGSSDETTLFYNVEII